MSHQDEIHTRPAREWIVSNKRKDEVRCFQCVPVYTYRFPAFTTEICGVLWLVPIFQKNHGDASLTQTGLYCG